MLTKRHLKITIDKIDDPQRVTKLKIKNDMSDKVLYSVRYFFILGFRIGFHLDHVTMKLVK